MTVINQPVSAKVLVGDAISTLKNIQSESVNCIVTSPPYWNIRDYGVEGQIGLEPTFEEFLSRLLLVFEQCNRVLRSDGVMFVNMGDSYAYSMGGGAPSDQSTLLGNGHVGGGPKIRSMKPSRRRDNASIPRSDLKQAGLKPKDLIGQPWRLAFALQAAGWYLRQDIIWHKPNPMPESIRDRCTKAHEYLFLLSKSERYAWDFEAMQEQVAGTAHRRVAGLVDYAAKFRPKNNASMDAALVEMPTTRNRRSVWSIGSEPNKDAHFATFPRDLVRPCVLAGCPAGGTVLDPFSGTGTTGVVALELGRNYIGIELNPEYAAMSESRLNDVTCGFGF